jgi:AcrR family transcriptional regulator
MGKSEETRQYIIEKASLLFNKLGYEGTSLNDITEAVGMTKGAIYGNFKNKDEIALESLNYNMRLITEPIVREIKEQYTAIDKLKAYAGAYSKYFNEIAKMGGCPLLNAATDSDDGNPLLKKKVLDFIQTWHDTVAHITRRGIRRKEIHAKTDPESFATLFITLIEGGIMLAKTTGDKKHLDKAINHITDHINNQLKV